MTDMRSALDLPTFNRLRLSLAILQPSSFCNIDCKYCYLPNRSETPVMTTQVLEQSLRFLYRSPGLLDEGSTLVWHCGEPLAVPISFYREAFGMMQALTSGRPPVEVCISTNATLMTQEWCDLIKQRGHIRIRVSIDGPQWLQDTNRVDRAGRGTFKHTMRGIELLRANGIPFDVLCVITKSSLGAAEELWRFFQEIRANSVGFCIEEILGEHLRSTLELDGSIEHVRQFFAIWLRLRDEEAPGFYVRELDQIFDKVPILCDLTRPPIRTDNLPFSLITIGRTGKISLFSPELHELKDFRYGDFIVGDVATHSVEDILASDKFRRIYADIATGVQECANRCEYFPICGGGFPVSKLTENGTFRSSETLTCRLRVKAIADVAVRHLLKLNRSSALQTFGPSMCNLVQNSGSAALHRRPLKSAQLPV